MATNDKMTVPFNRPVFLEKHGDVFQDAGLKNQISGNGVFTKKCEKILEGSIGRPTRLVTSATHALEMMALLADIRPGDEVILPSFSFVSTANPFVLRGARLRFADNDDFGNILPSEVERLYSPKTRAVIALHYAGTSADLDVIDTICKQKKIYMFEDAAQAIGATYNGRALGGIGALGCFSFHDTKNVTSGEGGAIIFGDSKFLERGEILREKGTNRSQFLQGLVDKYTWVDIGSSYVLSDLNAAYLYPQLTQIDSITEKRQSICAQYSSELGSRLDTKDIRILGTPAHNTPNYHIFALQFPSTDLRNRFIGDMKAKGITCPFHYVALHTSPFGQSFYDGKTPERLPGCDRFSQQLVRLPLYYNMSNAELNYVVSAVDTWLKSV